MDVFDQIVEAAGGQAALARALGIRPQSVADWRVNGIPAERVLPVERLIRRRVPRWRMRPDIYPPPKGATVDDTAELAKR